MCTRCKILLRRILDALTSVPNTGYRGLKLKALKIKEGYLLTFFEMSLFASCIATAHQKFVHMAHVICDLACVRTRTPQQPPALLLSHVFNTPKAAASGLQFTFLLSLSNISV